MQFCWYKKKILSFVWGSSQVRWQIWHCQVNAGEFWIVSVQLMDGLVLLIQAGICHIVDNLMSHYNHYQQMYFQSLFFSLGWSVSVVQHQPLYGKHNTETNHSQVSAHWSSVISYELMAPLHDQLDSQDNKNIDPHTPLFVSNTLSRRCQKTWWKNQEKWFNQTSLCLQWPWTSTQFMIRSEWPTDKDTDGFIDSSFLVWVLLTDKKYA